MQYMCGTRNTEYTQDFKEIISLTCTIDYRGIFGDNMDKHYCPDTVKRAPRCTYIVKPTIMDHYKDIHLDIDLLLVNKIQILLMRSPNFRFIYFKALLSKYNKYVKNRLQQII